MPSAPKTKPRPGFPSYLQYSQEPLQALFFLLPLVALYELATLHMARGGDVHLRPQIKAYSLLYHFLQIFDVTGYYLPGLIVVVVLFCWHLARRDAWRFEPRLYALMWGEAVLLAMPLLVWGLIIFHEPVAGMATTLRLAATDGSLPEQIRGLSDQLILSIGAGIYEELLFRLIAIALLHMIFCDLLALPHTWGASAAIIISAMAFGAYHFTQLDILHWRLEQWNLFLFYTCAGVYLAIVYVLRGFGIVAGTHAIYDILLAVIKFTVVMRAH